jgi:hypothetical protein
MLLGCVTAYNTTRVTKEGYKRLEFNKHLLCTFIDKLDLDPDLIL